jgi:Rrf2 family protein
VRLEVTRKADLSTRVLLALRDGGRLKGPELARRVGTTPGFLSQVVAPLAAHGWVHSEPGPTGGYAACFDPETVSLLEVIEAVEGPTDTGRCVVEDRPCGEGRCALHAAWTQARDRLIVELAATPLSALPKETNR